MSSLIQILYLIEILVFGLLIKNGLVDYSTNLFSFTVYIGITNILLFLIVRQKYNIPTKFGLLSFLL